MASTASRRVHVGQAVAATGKPVRCVEDGVKAFHPAAAAALITGLAACGTHAAGHLHAPGSPPPTLAGPATLTATDNGAIVRLHVGQQVAVTLTPEGFFSWHVPAAAGAAIKRVSASGGYPGKQPAQAAFLAVRPGQGTLSTINDTACLHSRPPCLPPQREWRVTIIVTGS